MKKPEKIRRQRLKKFQPNRIRRKSPLSSLLRLSFILLLGGLTAGGAVMAFSWLVSSPYFKIQKIRVEGFHFLKEEQVAPLLQAVRNESLFKVRFDEVQKRLKSNPWIRDVRLRKHFPDEMEVQITEKQPVGFIREGNAYYLSDADGTLISRETFLPGNPPEIRGIQLEKWLKGSEKEQVLIKRGIEFLQMADKPNFLIAKGDLTAIEIQSEEDLKATIGGTSFLFRYPFRARQWFDFLSVRGDILSKKINIENIDLRFTGKVIVRPQKERV